MHKIKSASHVAQSDRTEQLTALLAQNPGDAFLRYALALECVKMQKTEAAEAHFRQLLHAHPDYHATHYHYGKLLEQLGRPEEAIALYRQGVEICQRLNDPKALAELKEALVVAGAEADDEEW